MKTHLITCKTSNNAIGFNNKLLFHLKKDMQFFKKMTTTTLDSNKLNAVLMGKNTFLSIPKNSFPLKDRINLIISNNNYDLINNNIKKCDYKNTYVFNTIDQAYYFCRNSSIVEDLFIIGGESIYNYFVKKNLMDTIYITDILNPTVNSGESFFPTIDIKDYTIENIVSGTEENVKFFPDNTIIDSVEFKINKYININKNNYSENLEEYQYLNILDDVLKNGEHRKTRNAETISKFGVRMEFNITDNFPLLTTKKVYWKGIVHELLWFIKARTNANELASNGVKIWNGNSSRDYLDSINLPHYEEGTCGPIYGFQWRHFNADYNGPNEDYTNKGIDQLKNCIDLIKNDPTSRRIFMTAWNPSQLNEMVLPPCHVSYQFYVRNNTFIDCQMYQRSGDLFLGVPFNIASTALLTYIIANNTGYKPGKIIIVIGDAHIYSNHIEQIKIQLSRKPYHFPFLGINKKELVENYEYDDFNLKSYCSHSSIKANMVS